MRFFVWLFWAFIFFTLFAFALNNQQAATVRWFFGAQWQAPMVIVVLVAFAGGCAVGVLGMVPSWWRHRRLARRHAPAPAPEPAPLAPASSLLPSEPEAEHPTRVGL
jgi:uncharacterized integral membrane protein